MKIDSFLIKNFRGITRAEASNLGDTVIIAGQNGSGKSCVFDAIRLLKSCYGGYQQNEYQHFFNEFAIHLHGGGGNLKSLFNNQSQQVVIECRFLLRENEKKYINEHLVELLESLIWESFLPNAHDLGGHRNANFANQFREHKPEVLSKIKKEYPTVQASLQKPFIQGRIIITPKGDIEIEDSRLLSLIFSNYEPSNIGVIDFHGAQRHFSRENMQGINLNFEQISQQYSQHILYNYTNKYNNIKSEMAANYVKELLAEKADMAFTNSVSLTSNLQELFTSFFPEKKFLGPQPTRDGRLSFPVSTQNGTIHDLDELSSGEKEILYGYLRIRSSAPKESIILIDEPELHLNPRLVRGLPEFYRKHLGEALRNQIWMVTHSDALIREAVGKRSFNVFHMTPSGSIGNDESQLKPLTAIQDLEIAIADLVGDLAAYRPGGKALIFEGGGDSDFDKTLTSLLFPEELRGINLLSGSNKVRVQHLHEMLERAYSKGDLPTKFYAIVDKDSDDAQEDSNVVTRKSWDVYHIENYLLIPEIISYVCSSLKLATVSDTASVLSQLEKAARSVSSRVVQHKLRTIVNFKLVNAIDLGFDPNTANLIRDIYSAVSRSATKITSIVNSELSATELGKIEEKLKLDIENSFTASSWMKVVPGRDILKKFMELEKIPIPYDGFRNLLINRMIEIGYKPAGMRAVIESIIKD